MALLPRSRPVPTVVKETSSAGVSAIGGIDLGNAAGVLRAGADSLAVISAVFAAPDIGAAVHRFNELIEDEIRGRSDTAAPSANQP